jgi:hypothetical protein
MSRIRGLKIDKEFEKANFKAKNTIELYLKIFYSLKDGDLGLKRWLFIQAIIYSLFIFSCSVAATLQEN